MENVGSEVPKDWVKLSIFFTALFSGPLLARLIEIVRIHSEGQTELFVQLLIIIIISFFEITINDNE